MSYLIISRKLQFLDLPRALSLWEFLVFSGEMTATIVFKRLAKLYARKKCFSAFQGYANKTVRVCNCGNRKYNI